MQSRLEAAFGERGKESRIKKGIAGGKKKKPGALAERKQ